MDKRLLNLRRPVSFGFSNMEPETKTGSCTEILQQPKYRVAVGGAAFFLIVIMFCSIITAEKPSPGAELPAKLITTPPAPKPITISDRITGEELRRHLVQLQRVADENGHNRAMGTAGYDKSVEYVISQLEGMGPGIKWMRQNFTVALNEIDKNTAPVLSITGRNMEDFTFGSDFNVLANSGFGSYTGPLIPVDADGCNETHYSAVRSEATKGGSAPVVALISRGQCMFFEKMLLARAAGASAVCIHNNVAGAFKGTLGSTAPDMDSYLPTLGLTDALGARLREMAQEHGGVHVMLSVTGRFINITTHNIIADITGEVVDSVVIAGAHLDGVQDGPGINDNGSGTSALIAMARALVASVQEGAKLVNRVRFCWWAAEERGLLGSRFYVKSLVDTNRDLDVALNLNFDMLASPNWQRAIYNGSDASRQTADTVNGSAYITRLFQQHFDSRGLTHTLVDFSGRSDYGPFLEAGIPAGGLATGAEGVKSVEQRKIFGGLANTPYDPCYHQACDDIDNVGAGIHEEMADAAAQVLFSLVMTRDLRNVLNYPKRQRDSDRRAAIISSQVLPGSQAVGLQSKQAPLLPFEARWAVK